MTGSAATWQKLKKRYYEYKFVVFSHAAKAIGSPVAAEVVEGQSREEGRMSLTARDNALLPR